MFAEMNIHRGSKLQRYKAAFKAGYLRAPKSKILYGLFYGCSIFIRVDQYNASVDKVCFYGPHFILGTLLIRNMKM
jgi:hypothetical protein